MLIDSSPPISRRKTPGSSVSGMQARLPGLRIHWGTATTQKTQISELFALLYKKGNKMQLNSVPLTITGPRGFSAVLGSAVTAVSQQGQGGQVTTSVGQCLCMAALMQPVASQVSQELQDQGQNPNQ